MGPDVALRWVKLPESLGSKPKFKQPKRLDAEKWIVSYLKGETKTPPPFNYSLEDFTQLKDKASAGLDVEQLMAQAPEEVDKDDLIVAGNALNERLQALIPTNMSTTIFGVDEREPSDFEKSIFIRQMRVLEDPGHILDLIAVGQLSHREMEALKLFYPSYYEELVEGVLEAIAGLSGKVKEDMPMEQNRALSTLLEVPRLTPAILQAKREEPSKADISVSSEGAETEVQSVLAP